VVALPLIIDRDCAVTSLIDSFTYVKSHASFQKSFLKTCSPCVGNMRSGVGDGES
jgi:hypothetical protein